MSVGAWVNNLFHKVGLQRFLLSMLACLLIITTPFSDSSLPPEGMGLIRAVVLPASTPIVFMVVLLDFLMCFILKSDADSEQRARYHYIIKINAILAILLMLSWLPVFLKLI